jgi:voltage-gated potassium channel
MPEPSESELYLTALYYVITTMTTVGYGDISPTKINVVEMLFGILLMIGGVTTFSFASASLASIISNYDT